MPHETILFNILAVAAVVAFLVGAAVRVRQWSRCAPSAGSASRTPPAPDAKPSLRQRACALVAASASHVLAFREGLARRARLDWTAHVMLVWGALLLGAISLVANLSHVFSSVYYRPDAAPYAIVGDTGGLLLLIGGALVIVQSVRARRGKRPRTDLQDVTTAAFIIVLALSGYLVESLRLLSEPAGRAAGVWSFIGAPVATAIHTARIDWYQAWLVGWWGHAGLGLAFVAYLPHARLFRHIVAPVVEAVRTSSRNFASKKETVP